MYRQFVFTALVGLFLILPFILRQARITEPYPAILLPDGANKIIIGDGELNYMRWAVEAINREGERSPVEPETLFYPIPSGYLPYMAATEFGTRPDPGFRSVTFGLWKLSFTSRVPPKPSDSEEVRRWIASRLEELGMQDVIAIRISQMRAVYDVTENIDRDVEVLYEFTIQIY